MQRCGWVSQDPIYLAYHDKEWGIPVTSTRELFEMLCLEGQMAGLSWLTVLKKRENYRRVFHHFDPQILAQMGEADVDRLMLDSGIIRHRGKIAAIIANARALLAMEATGQPFNEFIWQFVNNEPRIQRYADYRTAPAFDPVSDALSKSLKQLGFKFVGTTTCYSFMQACGLICDHSTDCFCHPDNRE